MNSFSMGVEFVLSISLRLDYLPVVQLVHAKQLVQIMYESKI